MACPFYHREHIVERVLPGITPRMAVCAQCPGHCRIYFHKRSILRCPPQCHRRTPGEWAALPRIAHNGLRQTLPMERYPPPYRIWRIASGTFRFRQSVPCGRPDDSRSCKNRSWHITGAPLSSVEVRVFALFSVTIMLISRSIMASTPPLRIFVTHALRELVIYPRNRGCHAILMKSESCSIWDHVDYLHRSFSFHHCTPRCRGL